jgi:flagellar hook-length control protein FliK
MPIAFDPPTHAPHGTLPTRGPRAVEDDPASLDIFTQLLLAAASVQDAAAPPEPSARAAKDDAATAGDASVLCLPLPTPLLAGSVPAANTVTIVASEKIAEVRGASTPASAAALVDALRAARAGAAAPAQRTSVTDAATTPTATAQTSTPPTSIAEATASSARPSAMSLPMPTAAQPDAMSETPAARPNAAPVSAAASALAALVTPVASAMEKSAVALKVVEPTSAMTLAPAPTLVPVAPVHVETISAPAFTPGWQDETVSKLAQIVLTRNERAELKLNPAELGPVNVRVELRADQVSVQIIAASPETRSALEQSLPQLRDLLAAQGITLGQASVHDGTPQRDARAEAWTRPATENSPAPAAGSGETVHAIVRRSDRLLDLYA